MFDHNTLLAMLITAVAIIVWEPLILQLMVNESGPSTACLCYIGGSPRAASGVYTQLLIGNKRIIS